MGKQRQREDEDRHGVIQGYDGVAAVDDSYQIVVHAEAYGEAQEHELLQPMVALTAENFHAMGDANVWVKAKLTADAGFHTERTQNATRPRTAARATAPAVAGLALVRLRG